jgi:hypothetical protein
MQSKQLQDKLRQYHQKLRLKSLQERLERCLGPFISEVEIVLQAHVYAPDGWKDLNVFCNNMNQMVSLVESFLQNVNAGRWFVSVGSDYAYYPDIVLGHESLMKHIWKLVDEFELVSLRKSGARTSFVTLDKEDFSIRVKGQRWPRLLYNQYADMVMEEYSWYLFANGPSRAGLAFLRTKMFSKAYCFIGCLFAGEESELGEKLLFIIRRKLVRILGRELEVNDGTISDRITKQWLCVKHHRCCTRNDAIWRVEAIGQSFVEACKRALSEIRPEVITMIEGSS